MDDEDDIVAKKPEGKDFPICPAGIHLAICTSIIDLGTHEFEYKGKQKVSKKVRIVFETPFETTVFDENEGEKPFHLGIEYGLSLHKDAKLRSALEAWRGVPFTEEEANEFSLKNILGKACQIQVIHETNASGKTYPNISVIIALGKGQTVPEPYSTPTFVTKKKWLGPEFDALPEFVQNQIKRSNEWKQMTEFEPISASDVAQSFSE